MRISTENFNLDDIETEVLYPTVRGMEAVRYQSNVLFDHLLRLWLDFGSMQYVIMGDNAKFDEKIKRLNKFSKKLDEVHLVAAQWAKLIKPELFRVVRFSTVPFLDLNESEMLEELIHSMDFKPKYQRTLFPSLIVALLYEMHAEFGVSVFGGPPDDDRYMVVSPDEIQRFPETFKENALNQLLDEKLDLLKSIREVVLAFQERINQELSGCIQWLIENDIESLGFCGQSEAAIFGTNDCWQKFQSQNAIANHLNIGKATVSRWIKEQRPFIRKHRDKYVLINLDDPNIASLLKENVSKSSS